MYADKMYADSASISIAGTIRSLACLSPGPALILIQVRTPYLLITTTRPPSLKEKF